MKRRLELHKLLCDILESENAYFQPPETIKMNYPAIVYSRDDIDGLYADDGVYLSKRRYSVTVIDKDPDSSLVGKVAALPTCSFNRHYTKDNLNHDVFTLYF
nr:MAG TPA: tail completion protein [Caudoviricetes sp.]